MDFEAEEVSQSIPSRSSYAPSDKQKSYVAGDTIRFHIPQFDAFIDPRQTRLNFKVKVEDADALCRFSNKCGVHSLIEGVRVYDANSNLQLETLQNYNAMAEKFHLYSENTTIRNKRGLIEGVEYTSRNFDSELYDNLPSRTTDNSQLFNHSYKTGSNAVYTTTATPTASPNTIEVALHLYSGILGAMSNKMFPVMLTDGLRVEVDLAQPTQALELWTAEGMVNGNGNIDPTLGNGDSGRFGIISPTPTTANPLTAITLYTEQNAGFNQICISGGAGTAPTQASIDGGCLIVKNQLVGAVNLVVGKNLYGWTNEAVPVWSNMGTITSVSCNAGENAGGLVAVNVGLVGGVNGDLFVGGAGRDDAGAEQDERNNTCGVPSTQFFATPPKIVVDEVQFIIKTLQPPQAYVNSMLKQVSTSEGVNYDYLTIDTYRNNVLAGERVAQLNIPTLNHRATSIMTLPISNSQPNAVVYNNLKTIVDTASNYNYLIDNKLQPTRKVRLTQLSQTIPKTEQLALFECEKALSSIKIQPRQLDYQAENFFIARALARYGGVYNLAETGNASLRVEFTNPTQNKLMITFIGGLRRLVINKNGRYIET
tara:strand:- start:505 stop:2292 length:1788 start_codon:yes stop_codon:yes gene_type:complete